MKQKNIKTILIAVLMLAVLATGCFAADTGKPAQSAETTAFRGVWVSTVYNLDYPAQPTENSAVLKAEADEILENVEKTGFNAIFLQVRPCCDAFYPSELFPYSKYLTGTEGKDIGFDPLAYFVEKAHGMGIEVHAWINPYRVTKDSTLDNLSQGHVAKQHPEYVRAYEGGFYLDPGLPAVQQLVLDGVKEILDRYDVDGIHFDDYFYPGTGFPDEETFQAYGMGYASKDEWRRDNVTKLICETGKLTRSYGKSFGVSPAGIWANRSSNSLGSETRGRESYYTQYADSRKWVKEHYVDYICPQIYWEIGYDAADYQTLVSWWSDVVEGTDVKLYIGLAAYKTGAAEQDSAWYGYDEIIRQLELNREMGTVDGEVMFRYNSVMESELWEKVAGVYKNGNIPHTDQIYIEDEEQKESLTFMAKVLDALGTVLQNIFALH